MQLEQYLTANKISQTDFATKIGISRQGLHNLLRGAMPKIGTMLAIDRATKGAVTVKDWAKRL